MPEDERVSDEAWLELAGTRGWVVFMKDAKIRRNIAERECVHRFAVRCFCLSNQSLTGAAMAQRFLRHLEAITSACKDDGSFIYSVHETRIERLL